MPVTLATWSERLRTRSVRRQLWPTLGDFGADLIIFALGTVGILSVNVVGALPGDEIGVLILLPFLLLKHGERAFRREYKWFYILLAGWLVGTIIADLVVGSPMPNRLKGVARVVFLGLDFMTLAALLNKNPRRMIVFTLSIAAVMAGYFYQFRNEFLTAWKFGASYGLTVVLLLASCYFYARRKYSLCVLLSLSIAALNLIFAFRSQIGADLCSCVLTLPILAQERRATARGTMAGMASRGTGIPRAILLLGLAGGSLFLVNKTIEYAVGRHLFGEATQEKFQTQEQGKLGVLVGGRPETVVAIQAIRDSPIIGHGSFAVDPKYLIMEQDIEYEYGYTETDEPLDVEVPAIPTHSHLTMAWVESGILGGIFWIYILILLFCAIVRITRFRPPMAPLYCFFLVSFTWDILYSPMGSVNRIWGAYFILISYDLLYPGLSGSPTDRSSKNRPTPLKTRPRLTRMVMRTF